MNRRDLKHPYFRSVAASIAAILLAGSVARADELLAHGTGEMFWVARIGAPARTGPDRAGEIQTIIRARLIGGQGQWGTVARLASPVVAMAHRGTQVAVLFESGDWMLLWPNGSSVGARPEDGARLLTMTSNSSAIYAIGMGGRITPATTQSVTTSTNTRTSGTAPTAATQPGDPGPRGELALYKLERGRWQRQMWLPPDLTPAAVSRLSLALVDSSPVIAILRPGESVRTLRRIESRWEEFAAVDAGDADRIRLIANDGRPALWVAPQAGAGRLHWLTPRGWSEPRELEMADPPRAGEPRTIARAGNNLRLLFLRDQQIFEQTFSDDGTPVTSAAMALPGTPTQPSTGPNRILTLAAVAMLMIVVMGSLRRGGGAAPASVAAAAGYVPAPLLFRFVAGVLDALPLIIPCWFIFKDIDPNTADIEQLIAATTWPFYAALGAYLLYTWLSEQLFGRTLGKLMFGLRVISLDGSRPGIGAIFARNALRLIDVAMAGIPLVLVLLSPLRQRVGDIAAGTVVVSRTSTEASKNEPTDGGQAG